MKYDLIVFVNLRIPNVVIWNLTKKWKSWMIVELLTQITQMDVHRNVLLMQCGLTSIIRWMQITAKEQSMQQMHMMLNLLLLHSSVQTIEVTKAWISAMQATALKWIIPSFFVTIFSVPFLTSIVWVMLPYPVALEDWLDSNVDFENNMTIKQGYLDKSSEKAIQFFV